MKKITILFLLIFFIFEFDLFAFVSPVCPPSPALSEEAAAEDATCTEWESHTADDSQWAFGRYSTQAQTGFAVATAPTDSFCTITLQLSLGGGSIAAAGYSGDPIHYYLRVWSLSDSDLDLKRTGCLSDPVDGSDSWDQTDVAFTFSGTCQPVDGDAVVLFIDNDNDPEDAPEYDGTNYAVFRYSDDTGTPDFGRFFWSNAGILESQDTDDEFYRIIKTWQ